MNPTIDLTANSLDPTAFALQVHDHHFKIRDFIADPRDIAVATDQGGTLLSLRDVRGDSGEPLQFPVNDWAHSQLASFCDIPKGYYDRMRTQQHGLLDTSVRTWLDSLGGKPRMIRTLDGTVRAVVSNRYRRIDNYDVANTVLPVLQQAGATFRRLHVNEDSMIIQAIFREKTQDVTVGDTIMLGVTITNNEVGKGCVEILPTSLRLFCMNGATHNDLGHKRQHVGTRLGGDGDPTEFYADDTLKASDHALMLQLRDTVQKAADDTMLSQICADFQRALQVPITAQPVNAVTELAVRTDLSETEQTGILAHLMAGGTLTQYSMVQAITRYAQDVPDGHRAHEMEQLGGNVLAMAAAEFGPIATAGTPRPTRRRSR